MGGAVAYMLSRRRPTVSDFGNLCSIRPWTGILSVIHQPKEGQNINKVKDEFHSLNHY